MNSAQLKLAAILVLIPLVALASGNDSPAIKKFVAPAYPRLARDARIQGTAAFRITIGADGKVKDVQRISSHAIFATYVEPVLGQWEFQKSAVEHTVDVSLFFELTTTRCEGTDQHPTATETSVSAEFPDKVYIRTSSPCWEVTTSDPVKR